MNDQDREPIVAIALMAALADGQATAGEKSRLTALGTSLGLADIGALAGKVAMGNLTLADVVTRLSDAEARTTAYETAVAVCNADGTANAQESRFLQELRTSLGLDASAVASTDAEAAAIAGAPLAVGSGAPPSPAGLDDMIQKQAIVTGALELLPDRLANMAIIPLQLRLVYQIGQAYGQKMDADQVKDLAGTLGIGAAAQVAESAVRKLLGGLAGGLLGRALGGTTGLAAGAAVSFASTYALGHVAKQYYAQGRNLSGEDLRALFTRFQAEAKAIFPKVEQQVQAQAKSVNVKQLLGLRV
ncbi:MAG: TerB family tellurite resistance protein [Gemmatimonadales bacterium]